MDLGRGDHVLLGHEVLYGCQYLCFSCSDFVAFVNMNRRSLVRVVSPAKMSSLGCICMHTGMHDFLPAPVFNKSKFQRPPVQNNYRHIKAYCEYLLTLFHNSGITPFKSSFMALTNTVFALNSNLNYFFQYSVRFRQYVLQPFAKKEIEGRKRLRKNCCYLLLKYLAVAENYSSHTGLCREPIRT